MCKILAFTDTTKLNLKKHVNNIANTLLKSEPDGFGYAVQGKNGVYGEKSIAKTFRTRLDSKHQVTLPVVKREYSKFGQPSALVGAGLFHGRTSTNFLTLNNTHPMIRQEDIAPWYLIHNGVVTDYGAKYDKKTSNDSEDLLHRLINGGIEAVERDLGGYYAFACIDAAGNLHVARDMHATLFIAWSQVYNSYIIATTSSLLLKVGKMIGAKLGPIDEIEDDVYMIFKGNELVHNQTIKPRGFTKQESRHAQASLGRQLGGGEFTTYETGHGGQIITPNPNYADISEADWNAAIKDLDQETGEPVDEEELEYYNWRREVDSMDASYTVLDPNDNAIKVHEFKQLDHISQELCTIIRADGTIVDRDSDYDGLKLA